MVYLELLHARCLWGCLSHGRCSKWEGDLHAAAASSNGIVASQLNCNFAGINCLLQQIDYTKYVFAYSLMLYVEVPESSGLDLIHLFSLIVTIARYEGDSADRDASMWTCIPPHKIFKFHQSHHGIADIFFRLALSEDNSTASVSSFLFIKNHSLMAACFVMCRINLE